MLELTTNWRLNCISFLCELRNLTNFLLNTDPLRSQDGIGYVALQELYSVSRFFSYTAIDGYLYLVSIGYCCWSCLADGVDALLRRCIFTLRVKL